MRLNRSRILLGDDDIVLQRAVVRIAATRGYEVFSARTGPEVLAMASSLQPELIVLDIRFPDADGRDLLQKLKEEPSTAQIPVLVWSATENDSDRRIALNLGAEDFIEKGTPLALLPRIARVLLRLRQEQGLAAPSDFDLEVAREALTSRDSRADDGHRRQESSQATSRR